MSEYYKRQIQIWGEEAQENLSTKSICIIGCGGLGSSIALALGASGIGQIHLVDFDEITMSNIHRQIAYKIDDEGKYKADILSELLIQRNSDVKITAHKEHFKDFAKKDIKLDLIIDATDNLQVRSEIDTYAKSKNTPWIYGSVEEYNGQVCFFDKTSFNANFKVQNRTPKGQSAPMVMQIASFEANLALRYLVGLEVKKDALYYLYFDNKGEFKVQNFALTV